MRMQSTFRPVDEHRSADLALGKYNSARNALSLIHIFCRTWRGGVHHLCLEIEDINTVRCSSVVSARTASSEYKVVKLKSMIHSTYD